MFDLSDTAVGFAPMNNPMIVLVGADAAIVDRAVALGLDIILIQKLDRFDAAAARCAFATLILDYEDASSLAGFVRTLQRERRVLCAVSLTEFGLMPAARLNEALNLPGVPPCVVARTRDKSEMRHQLINVRPLPAEIVATEAEAASFGALHGWPIILKPVDGVGSKSVLRVNAAAELRAQWRFDRRVLAEKYVAGRLLSVEAFSFNGRHTVYGINEEFPVGDAGPVGCNPHVETAHQIPAMLDKAQAGEVADLVMAVLDALDIRDGPSHTEVILAPNSLHVLETHTRVGGDFIPEMLQRCTGIDLVSLSLAWPAGIATVPEPLEDWVRGAALRFFTPPPGRVRHVSGVEASRDLPGIAAIHLDLKPGDVVSRLLSSEDRVGFVMAVCSTSAEAMECCNRVCEIVKIEVDAL
jgi:biotin carboxylase